MDREEDVTIQAAALSNEPSDVPIQGSGAPAKISAPPTKAPAPTKATSLPPSKVAAPQGHLPTQRPMATKGSDVARPAPDVGIHKASEPAYRAFSAAAARAITESEPLRSKPWLAKKYEDCARANLVACDPARCTSKHDPLDLEDFTAEELSHRCIAFPVQGGRLSCYRPENVVRAWVASAERDLNVGRNAGFRVRDPLTNIEYCRDGSSYYDDPPDRQWQQQASRGASGMPVTEGVSPSLRSLSQPPFVHQSGLQSPTLVSPALSRYQRSQPRIAPSMPAESVEEHYSHRGLGEERMTRQDPEKTSSPIRAALQTMRRHLAQLRQAERARSRHPEHSPRTNVSLRLSLHPPLTRRSGETLVVRQAAIGSSGQSSLRRRNRLLTEELYEAHARQRSSLAQLQQAKQQAEKQVERAEKQAERAEKQAERAEKPAEKHSRQVTLFEAHSSHKPSAEAKTPLPPQTLPSAAASHPVDSKEGKPATGARAPDDPEDQMRLRARSPRKAKPTRKDGLTKQVKTSETLQGARGTKHAVTKLQRMKLVKVPRGRLKAGPREQASALRPPSSPAVKEDIAKRMIEESS